MFENATSPEQVFSAKLGSALMMELKLVDALEQLAQRAQREEIKQALQQHREETRRHARNIEDAFRLLGEEIQESSNPVVEALAKDGSTTIRKTDDSLVDAAVLAAATEAEHYEIAVYETLITSAEARGAAQVADLLRQNLGEEQRALEIASTTMKTVADEGISVSAR